MRARDKNRQTNKTMAETKITYEQHFSTLDKAEKMSELQDISIEFQKTEGEQRPKKEKKREYPWATGQLQKRLLMPSPIYQECQKENKQIFETIKT